MNLSPQQKLRGIGLQFLDSYRFVLYGIALEERGIRPAEIKKEIERQSPYIP